jgi:hypothetical protein
LAAKKALVEYAKGMAGEDCEVPKLLGAIEFAMDSSTLADLPKADPEVSEEAVDEAGMASSIELSMTELSSFLRSTYHESVIPRRPELERETAKLAAWCQQWLKQLRAAFESLESRFDESQQSRSNLATAVVEIAFTKGEFPLKCSTNVLDRDLQDRILKIQRQVADYLSAKGIDVYEPIPTQEAEARLIQNVGSEKSAIVKMVVMRGMWVEGADFRRAQTMQEKPTNDLH